MTHRLPLLIVLAACANERSSDSGRRGSRLSSDQVALEVRVRDSVERAAFVGTSHILVQLDGSGAFLYRRVDRTRIPLDVRYSGRTWRPEVTWSAPLSSSRVAAYDFQNRRVTIFDTSGMVLHATSLAAPMATPAPVAVFTDGGLLVLRDVMPNFYAQQTGAYADTTILIPVAADAEQRGPEIPIVMSRRYGALADEQPGDAKPRGTAVGAVEMGVFDGRQRYSMEAPLSPRTHVAGLHDGIFLGRSDTSEIRVLAPDGTERRRFHIVDEARPVDSDLQARLRTEMFGDWEPQYSELLASVSFPDRTPRYRRLLADREDRLWVERYPLPGDSEVIWTVYGVDGGRLGTLALPMDVRLLDATGVHLLVARPGAVGSNRLQMVRYALE